MQFKQINHKKSCSRLEQIKMYSIKTWQSERIFNAIILINMLKDVK